MIKGINGSHHIVVSGGASSGPYINTHSGQAMVGMVRYHNSNLEVYDGMSWMMIGGSYTTVDLTGSANAAINWAIKKMAEEQELDEQCKKYPGLQRARDNFEMFQRLVRTEKNDLLEQVQSSP